MNYSIHTIPAFNDNYLWLVADNRSRQALVVDPGDATPVLAALDSLQLELAAILVTHHHSDHTGGVEELVAKYAVPVYGPPSTRIPQVTRPLHEGDRPLVLGLEFEILAVPGHTLDHIAYVTRDIGTQPVLFCGDTLFAGGCGRLFEGTPAQMYESLSKLSALPGDTLVYCAHEYTLANLRFASLVEPDNPALQQRLAAVTRLRHDNRPSVPSQLADELATNPFLRCRSPSLTEAAARHSGTLPASPAETLGIIRRWKDDA